MTTPVSQNHELLSLWRQNLKFPISSPFERVDIMNESLHETLLRAIDNHGQRNPDRPALINVSSGDQTVTFGELRNKILSLAGYLSSHDFSMGDVAALVLHNCNEWPLLYIGVWSVGGIITVASSTSTAYELEKQFMDSKCSIVITHESTLDEVLHAVDATNIHSKIIKTVICIRSTEDSLPESIVDWNDVLTSNPIDNITQVDPTSIAFLPYSSGTTGCPKGVMISHKAFNTMIKQMIDHWEKELYPNIGTSSVDWDKEIIIASLPYYHAFGFAILNMSLIAGSTAIVMEKFNRRLYLQSIQHYRPRMLMLVPPILIFLTKQSMVDEYDISSLELVFTAAAPAGKDICVEFLSRHKNVKYLTQGYGMTELSCVSHLPLLDSHDSYSSVGVIAACFEQKIINPQTGESLSINESGELCVRSPTLMTQYLNRPDATSESIDNEGWMHTGDIAYMDKYGRTYIIDRLKELIKVKGYQVAPAEIEDLLLSHPQVADAAIIGIPDEKCGEIVRAYIVKSDDTLTEENVINFVCGKVSQYKHITGGVIFMDEIPKSPSGKILRRILRDQAINGNNQ